MKTSPSSGPQPWWQSCAPLHAPSPHGHSGHHAQSALGPGRQRPPVHTMALSQHGSPQLWPSSGHAPPSTAAVLAGHAAGATGGHSIAGQAAEVQRPPSQTIAGQPLPPAVGQHSPQSAPSSARRSPSLGSRPHQHTGSGSATAHCHRPLRHWQNMPPPQASAVPLVHSAPSMLQALPGASGFHGSIPVEHALGGQRHAVPAHTQPGGGGPWHVGGHVERSRVPGGHVQRPAAHTGASPASLEQSLTQKSQPPPPHPPPSPPASAPRPRPCESGQPERASGTRRR